MKYLITGASGFVGRHLLAQLVHEDQAVITALYNTTQPRDALLSAHNVSWVKRNVVFDELDTVLEGVDVVIHLAAFSSVSNTPEICEQLRLVNVTGTRRLSEAARKKGCTRFVFVSSIAAGEFSEDKVINEANGFPESCYGKSKKEAEDLLLSMQDDRFNVTVLRPTALFGEDHLGSIYELVRLVKTGRFVIIGEGCNNTNFLYIGDFLHDLLSVIRQPETYGKVYVSADAPRQLGILVSQIRNILGMPGLAYRIPMWMGNSLGFVADIVSGITGKNLPISRRRVRAMTRDVVYTAANLRDVLGANVPFGLERGLANTISWYRQAGFLD